MTAVAGPGPSFVTRPTPSRPRGPLALFGDAMRRPGGRRGLTAIWVVLLSAGVGMFAYPFATDLYTHRLQSHLEHQLANPNFVNQYKLHEVAVGDAVTRIRIPRIGLDVVVVEGTTPSALRAGAGHYVDTPLPGEVGNVGIAGHRTTYGHPFNRLDEVRPGDLIYLDTPFATYTYQSAQSWDGTVNPHPVQPDDISVLDQQKNEHLLTLTTCHPKGSAAERLVLRAVELQNKTRYAAGYGPSNVPTPKPLPSSGGSGLVSGIGGD